jgi:hypothetical protein
MLAPVNPLPLSVNPSSVGKPTLPCREDKKPMIPKDPVLRESLFHAAIYLSGVVDPETEVALSKVCYGLMRYGSFEDMYRDYWGRDAESLLLEFPLSRILHDVVKTNRHFSMLRFTDPDYPECLKSIPSPPPALYYVGNLRLLQEQTVAIYTPREMRLHNLGRNRMLGAACVKQIHNVGAVPIAGVSLSNDLTNYHMVGEGILKKAIFVLSERIEFGLVQTIRQLNHEDALHLLFMTMVPPSVFSNDEFQSRRSEIALALSSEGIMQFCPLDAEEQRHLSSISRTLKKKVHQFVYDETALPVRQ